jgi:hypothetical protein
MVRSFDDRARNMVRMAGPLLLALHPSSFILPDVTGQLCAPVSPSCNLLGVRSVLPMTRAANASLV